MIDYFRVLDILVPEEEAEGAVRLRKGVVTAINVNNTADITLGGVAVVSVPVLAGATISVAANVQILVQRGGLLILGKVGAGDQGVAMPNALVTFGTPTMTNGVVNTLTPTSAPVNTGSMWVSGSNLTIPTGQGGLYEMGMALRYAGQTTGSGMRQARFNVNGSVFTYAASSANAVNNGTNTASFAVARRVMSAADTVTFLAFQDSGGALALDTSSHAWLQRIA